jgi:hypothetical protein
MKHLFTKILAIIMLVPFMANAQITSGSIQGVIKDAKNLPVSGAVVKAIHTASGSVYGGRTTTNGNYVINGVRVGGPYSVEVSSVGSGKVSVDDIYVKLGVSTVINLSFSQTTEQIKEVVISGLKNNIFNSEKTGASTNVGSQQIMTMPTLDRRVEDFTRLTPQSGSSVGNANSFAGRDARYNNFQVNGANLNNGFGLSSGLTPGGSGSPISIDAIEEIQISVSPYEIRNTGFTGANINAVTRSGTNEVHGSVYGFYRGNGLNGDQVGPVNLDVPKFTNTNYGFRIGGPIIKNKLFFFVNAEREERTLPGQNWTSSNSTISGQRSRVKSDSLTKFSNFLRDSFGYNTGPYDGYANEYQQNFTKFLTRIDWNINDNNKFYVSYSQMTGTEDQQLNATSVPINTDRNSNSRIGANSMSFQNSNYNFEHTVRTITAELNSNLNSIMSNQLIGTYSYIQQDRGIPGGQVFPSIDINASSTFGDNYMFAGTDPFTYKNSVRNNNFSIINNLTVNLKNNTLTIGGSYEYQKFENSFVQAGNLYYRYANLSDFMNDRKPLAFGASFPINGMNGNTYVGASYGQLSAYVQDQFNMSDRLNLTFGVRFEMPFYDNSFLISSPAVDALTFRDLQGQNTKFQSGMFPKQQLMVSPRMSFNWDVNGDKTLQVRGGTGVFTGRIPFVWLVNQAGNIGTSINNYTASATDLNNIKFYTSFDEFLQNSTAATKVDLVGGKIAPSTINMVDQNFKMPQVWRSDIGIDYKMPFFGLIGTGEFMYTKDLRNIAQYNANLPAAQSSIVTGDETRQRWTNRRINSSDMFVLTNTNQGYSYSASVGLTKPATKGLFGSIFYTYTKSEDVSSNPGSRANSAWQGLPTASTPNNFVLGMSDFNTPHRVVASLSYKFKYAKDALATTISFFYEGSNPGRYSLVYNADINGDNANQDLIYVPTNISDMKFNPYTAGGVTFSAADQAAAFDKYISSTEFNDERGSISGRNSGLFPWFHTLDMKIIQDFNFKIGKRKNSIQVSCDIFNLPNLINPNSGKRKQLLYNNPLRANITSGVVTSYNFLSATGTDGKAYLPTNAFIDNISYANLWRLQFGVRYNF